MSKKRIHLSGAEAQRSLCVSAFLLGLLLVSACAPDSGLRSLVATPQVSPLEPPPTLMSQSAALTSVIPTPRSAGVVVHVVQPGDTIFGLALQYNVPVEQIYQLNGLSNNPILRVGQELVIINPAAAVVLPATPTPAPTLTPTSWPTIMPPIAMAEPGNLPRLTHNLLFVSSGVLKRWNHTTGEIEILVGPQTTSGFSRVQAVSNFAKGPGLPPGSVYQISVSNDGEKIVLERSTADPNVYDLALFDVGTRKLTPFYQGVSQGLGLLNMSISPDGKRVGWIPQDLIPSVGQQRNSGLAAPFLGGGSQSGKILVVATNALNKSIEVGHCGAVATQEYNWGCRGFLWSPDGQSLAWADGHGIYVTGIGLPSRQLISATLAMPNQQGQGVYSLQAWSPSGTYLLVNVGHYEGSTTAVLDTRTGSIAAIPYSFEYAYSGPSSTWVENDRLFIVRPASLAADVSPSIEIWRIDPASAALLVREKVRSLPVDSGNIPSAPIQLDDGHLAFALLNASNTNYAERGLYFAEYNDLSSQKVNGLPPLGRADDMLFPVTVIWSPDGSGTIIQDWERQALFYAPTNGMSPIDLTSIVEFQACCFTWIKR